jgi:ABC-type dipeptide/oligopeptide/nickel transport system ATPase component
MLRIALADTRHQVSIKHTASMSEQLEKAKRYLSQFDKGFTLFRDNAQKLAGMKYTDEQAQEYFNALFPAPDVKTIGEKALTQYTNKLDQIRKAFQDPTNQLKPMRRTWWQLVNTVTLHVDHHSRTRGKNQRARQENIFDSITDGQGADLKDKAMELALEMAV